jgi:hypothetical protein
LISQAQVDRLPELHYFKDIEEPQRKDTVVMTSYPRSGNTLLRTLLEKVMGVVTGSDCNSALVLNKELMELGLIGEGLVD